MNYIIGLFVISLALLANGQGTNEVRVRGNVKNSRFFNIDLCDSNSIEGKMISGLETLIEQWRHDELDLFCKHQCAENFCGCEPPTVALKKYKRQATNLTVIDGEVSDSSFFDVKVCSSKQFAPLKDALSSFITGLRKEDGNLLCSNQCERNICKCPPKYSAY